MYNNPYYNPQLSIDRINTQIKELENMRNQVQNTVMQQPNATPSINQTFQLAPNNVNGVKYASSIDDVNKEIVYGDTPFFSKDLSVLWIKNVKGEIKSYELKEIVQKDEKDLQIEFLMAQVEEMKKEMMTNAKSINDNISEPIESKEPTNVQDVRTSKAKSK